MSYRQRTIRRIYLAASSSDAARVREWKRPLELAGLTVVSTWLETIEKVGDANPRAVSNADRQGWARTDLAEIYDSDLLWFFAPPPEKPTRGAWIEFGYAHARDLEIVSSGDTKQSIFCALGVEFEADVDAFAWICKVAREGIWR
jgi:hypothetical protein